MMQQQELIYLDRNRAEKALLRAKIIERRKLRNGWRYIQVNKATQLLVPCDDKGKPTKEGQQKIDEYLNPKQKRI